MSYSKVDNSNHQWDEQKFYLKCTKGAWDGVVGIKCYRDHYDIPDSCPLIKDEEFEDDES